VNETEREQMQAEALDSYLIDLQSGRSAGRLHGVPADQAALLNALVDLAEANAPDASFARRLEAQLRAQAAHTLDRQAVAVQHPRPRNTLQGIVAAATAAVAERMSNVNRRLVFSLAGAAVLVLILFAALALLNPNRPGAGPTQSDVSRVAQAPTSTSAPIALATPAALPTNTLVPTATTAQETRAPTATPTETPLPPTATPTPGQPIPLPALARWQEGGYGGGGMGEPIPTRRTFVLGTALPESPEQMTVYLQREPVKLTADSAADLAGRLGVHGLVYQSLRAHLDALATVPDPDGEPSRGYIVVDGAREVMFEHMGIVHYRDRNRTSFVDGYWREPGVMPPLEQALQAAETFLHSAGLLEGEVETAATGDQILFYRLLGEGWPLVEPVAGVNIWTDGQVGLAQIWPLGLDVLADYPILSAQEAWDILSAGQPDERVWQYPYRAAEMPPWGEWRHQNPRFWARSYAAGQQVHRFGVPRVWFPTDSSNTPFLAMGDLVLTGDVQPLAEHILDLYVKEEWMYVHVWGEVQAVGEVQALRLEGWEPAEETYWVGTVRGQGDQATLVTDDGRTIQLPDLPADLADGTQVSVSGGQEGDRLEWHVIQEMSYAELPPEQRAVETQLTVEQVDLVYLALPPNVLPPERFAELGYRAVQPVWRFRGHGDGGTAFEFYVQAVTEAYVDSRS
jgi:hypothetical protein